MRKTRINNAEDYRLLRINGSICTSMANTLPTVISGCHHSLIPQLPRTRVASLQDFQAQEYNQIFFQFYNN